MEIDFLGHFFRIKFSIINYLNLEILLLSINPSVLPSESIPLISSKILFPALCAIHNE